MDKFYRFLIGVAFTFLLFSILVKVSHGNERAARADEYTIEGELEPADVLAIQQLKEGDTVNINTIGGETELTIPILKHIITQKLNTICLGSCESAGAVIFSAGKSHVGQQSGPTLVFHAPGVDLLDGSRISTSEASIEYWRSMYRYLRIDKLMSKEQWDMMWSRPEVVIEIDIK